MKNCCRRFVAAWRLLKSFRKNQMGERTERENLLIHLFVHLNLVFSLFPQPVNRYTFATAKRKRPSQGNGEIFFTHIKRYLLALVFCFSFCQKNYRKSTFLKISKLTRFVDIFFRVYDIADAARARGKMHKFPLT